LLEVSQVASLSKPHKANLHTLHRWLDGSLPGEGDSFLRGIERDAWRKNVKIENFVTIEGAREEKDATTAKLVDKFIMWYHHWIGYWTRVLPFPWAVSHVLISIRNQLGTQALLSIRD